eukprot:TRINITY_DN2759_c0_g1_i1.p1 TRINITY_DN2759_c0_g1~~TRINITY_DN2759_c0_g1_i1.p1  ORF type:complete len:127 (-),score=23.99 TRINITY_DN2759_c0_g1_i1:395-775(-)
MCKHILNAQVSIRAPCCKKWFDCAECHSESADHELKKTCEMVFACKKCKKVFRKDTRNFDEADEYCPGCDNHYYLPAVEPQEVQVVGVAMDSGNMADPRMKTRFVDPDDQPHVDLSSVLRRAQMDD